MSTYPARASARFHLVVPLLLIGGGIVLLLLASGALPPEVGNRLVSLWPLLLVMVGVELIVERTVPNAGGRALAAFLIVVVGLAGLAWAVAGWAAPGATTGTLTGSAAVPSSSALTVNAGAARVTVDGTSAAALYQVDYSLAGGQPEVSTTGSSVTVSSHREGWVIGSGNGDRLDVHVNPTAAWAVNLNVGAAATTVDLTSINASSVTVNGGAGSIRLKLGQPSGTVPVAISGGAVSVTVEVPAGVQARVDSRGAMSSFSAPGASGGTWSTTSYATAADRYTVDIAAAMSSVRVVEAS